MRFLAAALVALSAAAPLYSESAQTASLDLLRRATNPNPSLESYTASAELSATLHVLPVHRTFSGTVYYRKPRRKIEFANVSGPLKRFKELASSMPSYEALNADYTVTPLDDTGTVSNYSLVPKNSASRVKKVSVDIDDTLALVRHVEGLYSNGGRPDLDQSYTNVGSFRLAEKADIVARFPGYSVDGVLAFTNYKPNAPVSSEVFASP
jgi:hypothetical protein